MSTNRQGSTPWRISRFVGGGNWKTSAEELPEGQHANICNWRVDEETLRLRNGATAIPTNAEIGATNTGGAKGLHVWYPSQGGRHILAAYPRAASTKVSIYAVHTAGVTALGGDLATAQPISIAGFRDRAYISDGRNRLLYTDGVATAQVVALESPAPLKQGIWDMRVIRLRGREDRYVKRLLYVMGTPPHAGKYPEDLGTSFRFPVWAKSIYGTAAWTKAGTGIGLTVKTGLGGPIARGKESIWAARMQGTASIKNLVSVNNGKVFYSFGTGGTTVVGGVHFWAKSTRLGEFLKLELKDSWGSARIRDNGILFDQTGRWEFKQFMFDGIPLIDRQNVGSARIVLADSSATFTADFSNIYVDGLQQGDYQVAAELFDSETNTRSPLGDAYDVRAERGAYKASAFSLPAIKCKDSRPDRVRWYRRGGASREWRLIADVPINTHAWDFAADIETGDISPNVPPVAPRSRFIVPFNGQRMMALNGIDIGDGVGAIPSSHPMNGTTLMTAMSHVSVGGVSRGVEFFPYTSGAGTLTGRFKIKIRKSTVVQGSATIAPSSIIRNRWNSAFWASPIQVEVGSGTWDLAFSGIANCNYRLGKYLTTATPSYYHLLEYPGRGWVSRLNEPTWFDRYTRFDAVDEDGWTFDLPGAANERIAAHGRHGSNHLLFTQSQTFLKLGNSAADAECLRLNDGIGCGFPDTVDECDDWTAWVSGQKGNLRPYLYGPQMAGLEWVPAHEKTGFTRFGYPIESVLAKIVTPSNMHSTFAAGRYYLFFGETVSYKGNSYTGAVFDFAPGLRSWVLDNHSVVRMKPTRYAATLRDEDKVILAGPASTTPTGLNHLWHYEYAGVYKDGTSPISHIYESRHLAIDRQSVVRVRSAEIRMDAANAGTLTVKPIADGTAKSSLTYDPNDVVNRLLTPVRRFGLDAQGHHVGIRLTGTSRTAMTIHGIDMNLDGKR